MKEQTRKPTKNRTPKPNSFVYDYDLQDEIRKLDQLFNPITEPEKIGVGTKIA